MSRSLMTCIVAALVGFAMVYLEGPGLMRDVQLRSASLTPARDLKVEEAECTSHWWIVSNCSVKYSGPQLREKQSIHFSVFGTLGGQRFQLMRSPDNYVTTDLGVAKLANRITMAIFMLGLMAGVCVFSFRKAIAD